MWDAGKLARRAMIAALSLNVVILAPVILALLTGHPFDPVALGEATSARMILTSIYMSIALVSAGLVGLHLRRQPWAVPMTVALFTVQIVYKLITVALIGLENPVVVANVAVVVVQVGVLWLLGRDLRADLPRRTIA